MSSPDTAGADERRADRAPGISGLGAFRGRTTRFGAPVLPPGWRPDQDEVARTGTASPEVAVRTVDRPPTAPVGSRSATPTPAPVVAPDAKVVPARALRTEVQVVRKVRPWSVWKLTLAFAISMVAVLATAGVVLWALATSLGVLDNVEGLVEDMGFDKFRFDGGAMLRSLVLGGLIVAVAASVMASILAVMFNVLSDLTGGIETELAPKPPRRRTRRARAARRRLEKQEKKQAKKQAKKARKREKTVSVAAPPPPEVPTRGEEPMPIAGVEVAGRNGTPVLDLTDELDRLDDTHEVDHIQLALEDLLSDPPSPSDSDRPE